MTEHISAFDKILNVGSAPRVNGARVIRQMPDEVNEPKEDAMPRGIYERKPREVNAGAPKKRAGRKPKADAAPVAKTAGWKAGALAELRAKRDQIDAAILAIETLG